MAEPEPFPVEPGSGGLGEPIAGYEGDLPVYFASELEAVGITPVLPPGYKILKVPLDFSSETPAEGGSYPHLDEDPECRMAQTLDGVVWIWDFCRHRFLYAILPKPSGGFAVYDIMNLRWETNPEAGMEIPEMLTGPDQAPPLWAVHVSGLFRDARAEVQDARVKKDWAVFGISVALALWLLKGG